MGPSRSINYEPRGRPATTPGLSARLNLGRHQRLLNSSRHSLTHQLNAYWQASLVTPARHAERRQPRERRRGRENVVGVDAHALLSVLSQPEQGMPGEGSKPKHGTHRIAPFARRKQINATTFRSHCGEREEKSVSGKEYLRPIYPSPPKREKKKKTASWGFGGMGKQCAER